MKIVIFSRVVPYEGIPHAGGEYFLRHLVHIAKKHAVVVVAPDSPRNRAALERHQTPARVVLVGHAKGSNRLLKYISIICSELRPASAPREIVQALRADQTLMDYVSSADIVEFQWSENASLIRAIRKINFGARVVVVMHDVLRQKYGRRLRSARGLKQGLRALVSYVSSCLLEPRRLRLADEIIVFSEKDAELVASSRTPAEVSVVPPPLTSASSLSQVTRTPYSVLFTGAMDRPENDWGIQWFIRECWPMVVQEHPKANLTVAGALPSIQLLQLAEKDPSIRVTGYVSDLGTYYTKAKVFIVPLFQGAGVKFKTISAMLNGMPVVSTLIGAEGVGEASLFGAVTNDPDAFALAVVKALGDEAYWRNLSKHSFDWVTTTYGLERFHNALDVTYNRLEKNTRSLH